MTVEGTLSVNSSPQVSAANSYDLLMPLLEQDVKQAVSKPNGTLEIHFVSGTVLSIHDSNQNFEIL